VLWEEVETLLDQAKAILPKNIEVVALEAFLKPRQGASRLSKR